MIRWRNRHETQVQVWNVNADSCQAHGRGMPGYCKTNSYHKMDNVFQTMKKRTFGGDTLERILRDVIKGLQDFTQQSSLASRKVDIGDGLQKQKASARIIHFPQRSTSK
jgi:pentatricopeptide repeat protein